MIEVGSYNGWENKFTWLVHLHLSNEQALMLEILALVTREPDDRAAGWLIEMWVKGALFNCLTGVAGCASLYDGFMRLLAWDLAGSALAYADWDGLVALLTGRAQARENLFTLTLYRFIMSDRGLQAIIQEMLCVVPDAYACAYAMKD